MENINIKSEVIQAERLIRPFIRKTPLDFSQSLSLVNDSKTYLKLENLQLTGSFKARGSLNKVLALSDEQRAQGIITASTGNHALGVANALAQTKSEGVIYLPHNASVAKINAIKALSIPVELYGETCDETERFARKLAEETGKIYVSPYNDIKVIGGQGTIAIELLEQMPDLDYVLVSVGGGGLIAGIAGYLKDINPDIKVIGCLPENAPVMYECVKEGQIIEVPESLTLSDGTAGGIDKNSITLGFCQKYVDDYILVSEREIAFGMRLIIEKHHQIIEGSAGVSVAAFLKERRQFSGKNVALIMCGGNVSFETLQKIVCGDYDKDLFAEPN